MVATTNFRYVFESWRRIPYFLFRKFVIEPRFKLSRKAYVCASKIFKDVFFWYGLKNKHIGETVIVCGNGPSLLEVDVRALSNFTTFGSNKIFLQSDWVPTYYTVEDDLVLLQNVTAIRNYVGTQKLFPSSMLSLHPRMPGVRYFEFSTRKFFPGRPCVIDDKHPYPSWGSTVVFTQIQLALWMGAQKIVLVGVDFSFDVPKSGRKSLKEIVSEGERNHFHEDYRIAGEKWNVPNLHFQQRAFEAASEKCKALGVELLNASPGTKLEAIQKVSLEALGLKGSALQ